MKKGLIMSLCVLAFSIFTTKNVNAIEQLTTPGLAKETATKIEYTKDGYYAQKGEEKDWYKFQTPSTPGYTYIYIKNTGMDDRAGVGVYTFLDEELSYNGWISRNSEYRYHKKLEPNQVYYIKVENGSKGKTYIMDLDFIPDNVGNTKATGEEIQINKEYIWSIDGMNDYDYGYFTADKTGPYKFNFSNTGVDGRISTLIYNWNTDEKLYEDTWLNKGYSKNKILNLTAGQKVYFHIDSWSGSVGNYTFSIQNQTMEKITLNKSIIELNRGESFQLLATISPANAYDQSVSWSSNNTDIVRVDASGNIIANRAGQTLITCSANDGSGIISTAHVIVKPNKVNYVKTDLEKSTSKSVYVSWEQVYDADGYTVYGYDTKTKKWSAIKNVSSDVTEAQISTIKVNKKSTKLSSGGTYSFKVAAYTLVDGVKKYGIKSDTLKAITKPGTVTVKSITNPSDATVKITWNKVSGASGYKIYRYDSYWDYYRLVTTVEGGSKTSVKFEDYSTGKVYYKVSAYKKINNTIADGSQSKVATLNKKK